MMAFSPEARSNAYKESTSQELPNACPSCGEAGLRDFYTVREVPVHSVLLMRTASQAVSYRRGDVVLGFCPQCGFITNTAFNPHLQQYSEECEESQGFSPTFSAFQRRLAEHLIERYNLRNKTILEIGCGKGEFLVLLCELGPNKGIGFDPAYRSDRTPASVADRVSFVRDFYSEKYAHVSADFVCCKMTLEHIPDTARFVTTIRRALEGRPQTTVFFQVPDVRRILREFAFWDIYYEHCSYFSAGSMARLFRHCGFEVLDLRRAYGDQYLMLEAKPSEPSMEKILPEEEDPAELASLVEAFRKGVSRKIEDWERLFNTFQAESKRVVLWGSGSKAVAFLTTLSSPQAVSAVVDINPYRQGTFLPGTGHPIVAPESLKEQPPDVVIVMNPVYRQEISDQLGALGVEARLLTVD